MQNILQNNLAQIKELMILHGVKSAYAFGSAVTNTMQPGSDVDFVISFPSEMDYATYGENYFELLYALQDLLHTNVDLVAEETISNPYLIQSINKNKLQLL